MSELHYPAAARGEWKHYILSPNFRLGEFAVSADHPALALEIGFSEAEVERLRWMCMAYLEPMRSLAGGQALRITSGKRSPQLNAAVGGAAGSHHLFRGYDGAVDLAIGSLSSERLSLLAQEACRVPYQYVVVYPGHWFLHLSAWNGEPGANERRVKR